MLKSFYLTSRLSSRTSKSLNLTLISTTIMLKSFNWMSRSSTLSSRRSIWRQFYQDDVWQWHKYSLIWHQIIKLVYLSSRLLTMIWNLLFDVKSIKQDVKILKFDVIINIKEVKIFQLTWNSSIMFKRSIWRQYHQAWLQKPSIYRQNHQSERRNLLIWRQDH